jgi:hypothetical protein
MPLEDAPKRYTTQVHLRLQMAHLNAELLESVRSLATAHAGKCPLFLCMMHPTGEAVFIETHERFAVSPTLQLKKEVDDVFGEDTYYAKIDRSLPERKLQPWQRKAANGGYEE